MAGWGVYGEGDKARMPGMFKGLKLKRESPVTCLERTSSATLLSLTLNKLLQGYNGRKTCSEPLFRKMS